MSKKNKLIVGIVILFILIVVGVFKFTVSSGYKISITNNTNKTVEKLELKYRDGNIIQSISQIEGKNSWKYTVDTNSIEGENSIILEYKDNKGNSYEEYVVGYLEKGYSGKVNVVINNIGQDGKLTIQTIEKICL